MELAADYVKGLGDIEARAKSGLKASVDDADATADPKTQRKGNGKKNGEDK